MSPSDGTCRWAGLDAAYSQLQRALSDYLRRRLPSPDLAEDLLQEVSLKAVKAHDAGREIDNLTGWLYTAARTTVVDFYRSAGLPMEALDPEMIGQAEEEDSMEHQALATCLRPLIERLPPRHRETLIAVEYQGQSMRELASTQGVSVSAIKSRAARGRALLKQALLECCRVEISNGLVRDYQPRKTGPCCVTPASSTLLPAPEAQCCAENVCSLPAAGAPE